MNDLISRKALIEWLTSHFDLELDEPLEKEMIRLINDQEAIQPQGIDKDMLIEELEKLKDNKLMDIRAYSVMSHTLDLVKDIINQQPTSDGWIPCGKGSRLTRRAGTDDVYCIDSYKCVDGDCYDCPHFAYMRNKLACYEELEEQGRLAYLPYKESE